MLPAVPSTSVSPGLILPALLGAFDHRKADAILDRSAGIGAFELEEKLAVSAIETLRLDDRRLADQFEHAVVDRHAGSEKCRFAQRRINRRNDTSSRMPAASRARSGRRPARHPRGAPALERISACSRRCSHIEVSMSLARSFSFFMLCSVTSSDREYAEFGIAHFAVELLVALIQRAELVIALDQIFDVLLLVLEHQLTSSLHGRDAAARARRPHRGLGWSEMKRDEADPACAPPAGDGGNCGCGLRSISIMDSLLRCAAEPE